MIIKTSDPNSVKPFIDKLALPKADSHKGQNGRVLVIGGSSLFHSSTLWAAEIASHFVDMVHFSSTEENNQIFINLKSKFRNGIVIKKENLLDYVGEDDAILVGPGMIRRNSNFKTQISNEIQNPKIEFKKLLQIQDEGEYTYFLTKNLIENFPKKKFIFDAGALQMMEKEWLLKLEIPAVVTPHLQEFEKLFGKDLHGLSVERQTKMVVETAAQYHCTIVLKAVNDIISDGQETIEVKGGNAGLTKGGTGDILAGLITALSAKNNSLTAVVIASYILKYSAERLFLKKGYWYNIDNLIQEIPECLHELTA